jgi:hypothetical protein
MGDCYAPCDKTATKWRRNGRVGACYAPCDKTATKWAQCAVETHGVRLGNENGGIDAQCAVRRTPCVSTTHRADPGRGDLRYQYMVKPFAIHATFAAFVETWHATSLQRFAASIIKICKISKIKVQTIQRFAPLTINR